MKPPIPTKRFPLLDERRNLKMARSPGAYVRGSTAKFYEWLETAAGAQSLPEGPPVWICGDCHIGNLGPIANADGDIEIQIRDLDHTVIGNPAHDLIRLGLSLASTARGSDLPGVTTAMMLEQMIEGYEQAFRKITAKIERPETVKTTLQDSMRRTWKHLAKERIENTEPTIPLGKRFWPISLEEKKAITRLFEKEHVRRLVTSLRMRENNAPIKVLDAAYWRKGCSSLGYLRFAILLHVGDGDYEDDGLCLIDMKEAVKTVAPRHSKARIPNDYGERVVMGAQHVAPFLGERMLAETFLGKPVFLRELMPQDLQLEIAQLNREEAVKIAKYLAFVVGIAHARQMDKAARKRWHNELQQHRSKTLDAPSWLWKSVVELMAIHETAYLEHCRRYAGKS